MKIGITGDTHGDFSLQRFKAAINRGFDTLIITGDFGYIYDGSQEEIDILDKISTMNLEILFLDGNHENFNLLNKYPTEEYCGGTVHLIRKNIRHLMRGQLYQLNDKKVFTFGGAKSIDRAYRTLDHSYWLEEVPNRKEMDLAVQNLATINNNVDIILTHTVPTFILNNIVNYPYPDETSNFLNFINDTVNFNIWYAGHMHVDTDINDKYKLLYRTIQEF